MAEIEVEIVDKTPELFQKLNAAIGRFVKSGIGHLEGRLGPQMEGAKSGRMYGKHQASAPGESPGVDTGNLVGSIVQIFPSTLEGLVGTPVPYALYLEEGTKHMDPRPLWEKTRVESLPSLEKLLDAEIDGIAKRR